MFSVSSTLKPPIPLTSKCFRKLKKFGINKSWVFAWLDTGKQRYLIHAVVYLAPYLSYEGGQSKWRTRFALNTSGPSNNNGSQDNPSEENTGVGRTRLGIIVRAAGKQLLDKLNSARKNFPVKIFLLLLGFYTANALATILGQTGDWDVLVAGIVVAAIEGIGMLMYKKRASKPVRKFQSFILMVNYWKAGVCLGLFVDAFKLGS